VNDLFVIFLVREDAGNVFPYFFITVWFNHVYPT